MEYNEIVEANFIERPNRFIAYVDLAGERTKVHVKNTGRCRELLRDRARVYLERSGSTERATAYDLIAVEKDGRLINMDSAAPNRAVGEWLREGGLYRDVELVRPETVFGGSRFDFYVESRSGLKAFVEVKGVTLEQDNIAFFPDAPSERAVRHVEELIEAHRQGYESYLVFVVQMEGVRYVEPNRLTHPAFAEAVVRARNAGVHLLAYDCTVEPGRMAVRGQVPVVADVLDRIAKPLLAWYDSGRRVLPWRSEPTPYHVWLSEIMLQQTRVEAVKPYYDRFIKELPTIEALAGAKEERLLKLWEGLGYYNRARNLKASAVQIMEEYGGRMPSEYEKLIRLKGIGSYTAGAIASIAFGQAVPAVDGNVLRVLARLRSDGRDILDAKVRQSVEDELRGVIPRDRAGDFNQALMELGAVVCIPNGSPACGQCPWEKLCLAHREGRETEFPHKAKKKQRTVEEKTVLLIRHDDKTALCRRPSRGLLAGMYEFPSLEGHRTKEEVLAYLRAQGVTPIRIRRLPESKHIFTHKEWHMTAYQIRIDDLAGTGGYMFVTAEQIERDYPVPSAFAAYYTRLKESRE